MVSTDEHVVKYDRGPLSEQKQLTGKKLKEAKKKERKIRNADRKKNANKICKSADTLQQVPSSDVSIENAIEEGSQLPERFAAGNYTEETLSKNITEGETQGESHKNQSITSSNNSVEKSPPQSCTEDENIGEVSSTLEFKTAEPDNTEERSAQSYQKHAKDVLSPNLIEKELNEKEKLYKCLFEVCRPVLQGRLDSVVTLETKENFSKYLKDNIHYFFHQFKADITCGCTTKGPNGKCTVLEKMNNKVGKMSGAVFFNLYENMAISLNSHKGCKHKFCLQRYSPKKRKIKDLDFNDLQFFLLECDKYINKCLPSLTEIVDLRNRICHPTHKDSEEDLQQLWEPLKEHTLNLYTGYFEKQNIVLAIHNIQGLTTLKPGELENLRKAIINSQKDFQGTQDENNRKHAKTFKCIAITMTNELKEYLDKKLDCNNELIGSLKEEVGKLNVEISLLRQTVEQGPQYKIEGMVTSLMINEDKAVEVLSQEVGNDKDGIQIESIKKNCLLLELKASPTVFRNEETLRFAIRSLIERIVRAGDVDTSVSSTINVAFIFKGQLMRGEEDVIRGLLSFAVKEEENEDSNSVYQREGQSNTVIKPQCQSCEEKDKKIKDLEEKTKQHDKSIEKYKLQEKSEAVMKQPCQSCEEKEKKIKDLEEKTKEHDKRIEKYKLQAGNSYTKTEGQKGLAIIVYGNDPYLKDPIVSHLKDFFEELGFVVVKCIGEISYEQLEREIYDGNFYCMFYISSYADYHYWDFRTLVLVPRFQGKPKIHMTNSTRMFPICREPDTLVVSTFDRFRDPCHEEYNIFEDFLKVTRCNRFADIMDILTRMIAQYDRPVITFQSTLRKKFSFL